MTAKYTVVFQNVILGKKKDIRAKASIIQIRYDV